MDGNAEAICAEGETKRPDRGEYNESDKKKERKKMKTRCFLVLQNYVMR